MPTLGAKNAPKMGHSSLQPGLDLGHTPEDGSCLPAGIPHPIAMRPRKDGAPGWRPDYFASVIVPKRPLA